MRSLIFLSSVILQFVVENNAVTRPPSIYVQSPEDIFYKPHETVQVQCVANGMPTPEYRWTRNKVKFSTAGNERRMVKLADSGTISMNDPQDQDEGIFQCLAENDFGISVSININFRLAKLMPFRQQNKNIQHEAKLGWPLTLECVPPESIPPPQVYWIIKEENGLIMPINYNDRISMDLEYRLRFTNVKASDHQDGKAYACMAMNPVMRQVTQGAHHVIRTIGAVEEQKPVAYLWASPDDHFGIKDTYFKVKCIFSGNPTPDVHWERENGLLFPDHVKTASFGQELVFNTLQFSDEGKYECWATNNLSQRKVTRSISLRVESKPYWKEEPQDLEVGIGSDADFHCNGGGVPEPSVRWFINGVPFKDVTDRRIDHRFKKISSTYVSFVNLTQEDYMVIQCNISNKHGYIWGDFYLNVLREAPTILDPPQSVLTAEGQSVNLTCGTTGKPDPQITWIKDGQQITGGRYRTLVNGNLLIENVVLSDAGYFVCEAENRYGKVNASGTLNIRRKTIIEQWPLDLEVNAGTDAKFTCSATTDPEEVNNLKIKWLKDFKDVTANKTDNRMTTNKQDNSLTISGTIVLDSGTYICIATNGLDESQASAMLTVRDKPNAPNDVKIKTCTNRDATVRWTPGSSNNAPVQYFIVQFNTTFNPDQWTTAQKVESQTTVAVIPLRPYANYTFRVKAINKIGESETSFPTQTVCSLTQAVRPAKHPQNVRTIGDRQSYLSIEWTPMPKIEHGGPSFEYRLHIKRQGDAIQNSHTVQISDWRKSQYDYETNDIYQPYEITVEAWNTIGDPQADAKTIIGYSGEDVPGILPSDLTVIRTNTTTADLSWKFDMKVIGQLDTPIRGEFKGFKIQFWTQNHQEATMREWDVSEEQAKRSAVGNLIHARLEYLLPYTNVEARVSVMNNFYVSRPSDTIRFQTKEGVPGPVEFFKARNIGDNHFNLDWGRPMDENGIILGYDITYQRVRGLDLDKMQDREPQINDGYKISDMLSGLLPYTRYRVYIYARTSKGRGESYFIELTTTKPGNPEAPRHTIADVKENSINVTWWVNPYARSGTVIFVEYRKEGAPEWQRSTDEVFYTWKDITELEPGTTYDIRVVATNSKKRVASSTEKVTTLGVSASIALVGNIGWFIGLLLSVLAIIGSVIFFYFCHKRGFKFNTQKKNDSKYQDDASYTDTSRIPKRASEFAPEPRGYSNDYYDDKDSYVEYDDHDSMKRSTSSVSRSMEKHPPSDSDDDQSSNGEPPIYKNTVYHGSKNRHDHDDNSEEGPGPYEDYDYRESGRYDPEYDEREPDKFDKEGYPRRHRPAPSPPPPPPVVTHDKPGGGMSSFV